MSTFSEALFRSDHRIYVPTGTLQAVGNKAVSIVTGHPDVTKYFWDRPQETRTASIGDSATIGSRILSIRGDLAHPGPASLVVTRPRTRGRHAGSNREYTGYFWDGERWIRPDAEGFGHLMTISGIVEIGGGPDEIEQRVVEQLATAVESGDSLGVADGPGAVQIINNALTQLQIIPRPRPGAGPNPPA